jgi:hypothetical protein
MIINAAGPCRWTYSWNLQTKTLCNPSQNPNYKVHSKIEQINLAKEPLPIYKILWRNDWPCTYKKKCWKLSEHLLLKLFGLMWADERVLKCYKFWSIGHVLPPYSLETKQWKCYKQTITNLHTICWALPPQGQGLLHWIQLLEVLPY